MNPNQFGQQTPNQKAPPDPRGSDPDRQREQKYGQQKPEPGRGQPNADQESKYAAGRPLEEDEENEGAASEEKSPADKKPGHH